MTQVRANTQRLMKERETPYSQCEYNNLKSVSRRAMAEIDEMLEESFPASDPRSCRGQRSGAGLHHDMKLRAISFMTRES